MRWYVGQYTLHLDKERITLEVIIKAHSLKEAKGLLERWCTVAKETDNLNREPLGIYEVKTLEDLSKFASLYITIGEL